MTNETKVTLDDLIRKALERSREPDPHVIARRLLTKLPDDVREQLVLLGLAERVALCIRVERAVSPSENGDAAAVNVGPSKWKIAQRVCVGSDWKLLADCDLSDLHALASQHRQIAAKNVARAEEYERLAVRLRDSGCVTLGELWKRSESLAA